MKFFITILTYSSGQKDIKYQKTLKQNHFPAYFKYTCVNAAYSGFINKFMRKSDSFTPIKKERVKANSKFSFHTEIIS